MIAPRPRNPAATALLWALLTALLTIVPPTAEGRPGTPRPHEGEAVPYPEVRAPAIAFVETSGSWSPDRPAAPPGPLADPAPAASTRVLDTQIAGLTETSASVIVLARQDLGASASGPARTREVAVDVRLLADGPGRWRVTDRIDPPRPAPAPPGPVGAVAQRVLADPRIDLSAPAREDIASGRVDEGILRVAEAAARERPLRVHVAVTGHPGTVFPTTRLSNHAVGRALDIRGVDGRPVGRAESERALAVMTAAARAGATEVGGPITVDGPGFFTDAVHQDHIHVGITPTKPPAVPPQGGAR